MISEFTRFMQLQPLLIILPSLVIILLSAGWNLLADGMQDYLAPRREPAFSLGGRSKRRPKPAATAPSAASDSSLPSAHDTRTEKQQSRTQQSRTEKRPS
jgi:peptide/nickel transport system permease protein